MNNLNTVLIEGNLTRDPKEVVFAADHEMCRFSIANNRYYMKKGSGWQTDTSFFIVEVYGSASRACMQHLRKGRGVRVVGRLKQNTWKEGGVPREFVTIIAEHIEFQPDRQKAAKDPIPTAAPAISAEQSPKQAVCESPSGPEISESQEMKAMSQVVPSENQLEGLGPEDFECTTDIPEETEEQEAQSSGAGEEPRPDEGGVQEF